MDDSSASDNTLWPGLGVLSCAALLLFAGYVVAVMAPSAVPPVAVDASVAP